MYAYHTPILFIPGLFGCMSSEIVPHTGSWQFGFAKSMYQPFVQLLEKQGIATGSRFFTLFYDWQQTTAYNVTHFLLPMLKKIKKITHSDSLFIIAHGTGGYLARYALSLPALPLKITQLFLIGTPNAGIVSTFSYLTGGELHLRCGQVLDFIPLYFRMHCSKNMTSSLAPTHYFKQAFPALYEMLPSRDYGRYLFYHYQQHPIPVNYQDLLFTNPFLDQLNDRWQVPLGTTLHLIAGDGYPTIHQLEIAPICSDAMWSGGKVLDCLYTDEGDGLTSSASVFAIAGNQYLIKSHYETLLVDASPIYLPIIN